MPIAVPTGSVLDIPRALPSAWLLVRYFRKLFAERRLRPRDDLISALVQAEEAGDRLSADELLGTAMLLVAAGYETTVHLIASSGARPTSTWRSEWATTSVSERASRDSKRASP